MGRAMSVLPTPDDDEPKILDVPTQAQLLYLRRLRRLYDRLPYWLWPDDDPNQPDKEKQPWARRH